MPSCSSGPAARGKTSLARILAKAVNCTNLQDGDACDRCPSCVAIREGATLDLIEIDAASNRGIDAVRDLRERLPYPPGELRRKVYILDEGDGITKDAWNALLEALEQALDLAGLQRPRPPNRPVFRRRSCRASSVSTSGG